MQQLETQVKEIESKSPCGLLLELVVQVKLRQFRMSLKSNGARSEKSECMIKSFYIYTNIIIVRLHRIYLFYHYFILSFFKQMLMLIIKMLNTTYWSILAVYIWLLFSAAVTSSMHITHMFASRSDL